jgi:hypothetical protein
MSPKPATAETIGVTLLRMGVGKQEFDLPDGSTLGDLLRAAGVDPQDQTVFIDGKPLEDRLVLRPGKIVSTEPHPKNAPTGGSWQDTIGMFRDDPLFEQAVAAGRAYRER